MIYDMIDMQMINLNNVQPQYMHGDYDKNDMIWSKMQDGL